MLLKRWYYFKRDWRMWILLLLPSVVALFFVAYGLMQTQKTGENFFDLKNVTVPSNNSMPLYPHKNLSNFNLSLHVDDNNQTEIRE